MNKIISVLSVITSVVVISASSVMSVPVMAEKVSALGEPITSETTIHYDRTEGTILDLGHKRTYGAGWRFDWTLPMEGYCGFIVTTSGSKATLKHYTHLKKETPGKIKNLTIRNDLHKVIKTLDTPKSVTDTCTIDFSGFENNKLYYISEVWDLGDFEKDDTLEAPVFLRDGVVYTCMYENSWAGDAAVCKERWEELFADADPKDYLSLEGLTYPTSGVDGHVVQVEEWRKKAHELIKNDNWSDEAKVFAFAKCLATDYAYDDYRYYVIKDGYRANEYKGDSGFKMDSLWMYYSNVGVCWDYTNALTIMCREYGIPCTSADNETHTIAAVWLNDRWVPIDMTLINNYQCPTKDTDKSNWEWNKDFRSYAYGGYWSTRFLTHDEQIWTKKTALGL